MTQASFELRVIVNRSLHASGEALQRVLALV